MGKGKRKEKRQPKSAPPRANGKADAASGVVAVAAPAAAPSAPPTATVTTLPVADGASETRTRKRLPFEVHVDVGSQHNFFAGLSLNISEGGIFVATHVEHPMGTRLEVRFLLPGDEEPVTVLTEVCWIRLRSGNEWPGLGLKFVDLDPFVLAHIQRFVAHRDPLYYED